MDRRVRAALKQSFAPPPTQRLKPFASRLAYPKATFCQVLLAQICFIRKRVWVAFLLGVCLAFSYAHFVQVPAALLAGVSALLPFFSLCATTEVYKSTAYRMEETELVCKHHLPQIVLMRLGILGTASLLVLGLLVCLVGKSGFGLYRNSIYIGMPYLLTSYLSLLVISKLNARETLYICGGISGAVSTVMVLAGGSYQFIYHADFTAVWAVLFTLLVGLLAYSLMRFIKLQEELQWNLL